MSESYKRIIDEHIITDQGLQAQLANNKPIKAVARWYLARLLQRIDTSEPADVSAFGERFLEQCREAGIPMPEKEIWEQEREWPIKDRMATMVATMPDVSRPIDMSQWPDMDVMILLNFGFSNGCLNNEISNAVAELTRRAAAKRVTVGDYIDELLHEHRHEVEKSKQCYEALPPAKRHRFAELLVLRKAEGLEGLDGLLQACHPTMNNNCRPAEKQEETRILVEGPVADAEFYGQWLLAAAKAQKLFDQAKRDDAIFDTAISVLEAVYRLDHGISAMALLQQLDVQYTFLFDLNADEVSDAHAWNVALMAEMGFFTSTGDYYQMTLPKKLDVDCVKQAHLKLVGTVDDEYLVHSERLLTAIPYARAVELRKSLHAMDLNARLADRRALLFED